MYIIHAELLYLKKAELSQSMIKTIKARLTVRSVFQNRTIPVYSEDAEYLGVPRYFRLPFSVDDNNIADYRVGGTATPTRFTGVLRKHQLPAIRKYERYVEEGVTGVLLNAQTGSGKTVMAIKMMDILRTTTLIIVPKSDLMDQWRDRVLEFTNLTEDDIGYAQQKTCDYKGKAVVIGMLQSLCKDRYSEAFKQYFGTVIADEVHRLSATEFSRAAKLFPAKYRLGLSASMDRVDGTSAVFYLHLSSNVINVTPSQPKPEIYKFHYAKTSGVIPKYLTQSQQRRGSLISMLANNMDRTKTLAILTKRLADSGRQTVVLSERKAMLKVMKEYLVNHYGMESRDVGIYVYETSKKEKERIALECKIILATSKMLSEGTDIASLRALVFATPMSNVLQPVGRIRRIGEKYKSPIVLDFVDTRYRETTRWFNNRRKWYNEQKFKLTIM